ncbi:C4-dicarboxylate TRAP transporter substrate-binding protein [Marinibaculum pumilum]|uniref:C4-dicarboxylate TRAP transporter substrate-binding protein n=1 Tax=Marinibaculum pumilum TaxID=1766165 RepID=A0ABV7L3T9_9PROT
MTCMRLFATGLAAGLVLAATAPAAVQAEDYDFSSWSGLRSTNHTLALQPFFDELKEKSNGEINWILYPGGQLMGARETLGGVRDGVADAGFIAVNFHPSELKHNNVLANMVFDGSDPVAVGGAINETIMLDCPSCDKDWVANNLIYLGGHTTTGYVLMCAEPFDGLEGIKGKKVRATGAFSGILTNMEAVPVNIPPSEMAEGLERGQIDCVLGPIAWLEQYSVMDQIKYVLDVPFGTTRALGLFTMNLDSWNDMSPEHKALMIEGMPGMVARAIGGYISEDERARANGEKKGITFAKPDDAFLAKLADTDPLTKENIATAKSLGVDDAQEIAASFRENLAKWQKIAEQNGHDIDKFEAALKAEIYDKMQF